MTNASCINGASQAVHHAVIRAIVTIAGLTLFWLLDMQDLPSLAKAAAFTLFANIGLAGLCLLGCRPKPVKVTAFLLNGLILLNAAVEGFLFWLYGLTPKHIVVADAIFGSNRNEIREFIETYWARFALVTLLAAAMVTFLYWAECRLQRVAPEAPRRSARNRWLGTGMVTLFTLIHLNPTMAEENPLVYWPAYLMDYHEQRAFLADVKRKVAADLGNVQRYPVAYVGPPRKTVVLVLGESVNRSNWSLYGYPRRTTPELAGLRDEMLVFKNVVSSDAATVQSLLKMLTPATLERPNAWLSEPNVLTFARAAGYHVTWLSNQEQGDGPIQILAEHAHEQIFVNAGSGRAARSLDERLLPRLERILAQPAPLKLIIVHMQGAHLRYDLRYPASFDTFSGAEDDVATTLEAAGRPYWVRTARNQYDNAMLYTDHILASMLRLARQATSTEAVSVLYVSDHGQEVGHYRDFVGHSSTDPSGYEVPLLLWTKQPAQLVPTERSGLERRHYRTDNLDHTLLGLLTVQTDFYQPEKDLLNRRFQHTGSALAAVVDSIPSPRRATR